MHYNNLTDPTRLWLNDKSHPLLQGGQSRQSSGDNSSAYPPQWHVPKFGTMPTERYRDQEFWKKGFSGF